MQRDILLLTEMIDAAEQAHQLTAARMAVDSCACPQSILAN